MPQAAPGFYGIPRDGPILWSTGTRGVSTYPYAGVFTVGAAGADVPMTPSLQVARGVVTASVIASAGTGTNVVRIYQNEVLRGSVTITSTGTLFSVSFTASDGDMVRVFVSNVAGTGMTVSTGTLSFVRSPLVQFGRSIPKLGLYGIVLATYTIDLSLMVALSPPFRVARGRVHCNVVVAGGTGSNVLTLYRNGASVATTAIPSPGTYTVVFDADDNDLMQLVSANTNGNNITVSAGSTVQSVRSRA